MTFVASENPFVVLQSSQFMEYSQGQNVKVAGIILIGSINALCYNVIHYLMIQMTSAVTTTVLGEIKIVGLLLLSIMLLGKSTNNCYSCVDSSLREKPQC